MDIIKKREKGAQPSGCAPETVLAISGTAGVGVRTLLTELCRRSPGRYALIKQITTRAQREPEDGYVFATTAEFQELHDWGALLGDSVCCGQHYAFDKRTILSALEEGRIPILIADPLTLHHLLDWDVMRIRGRVLSVFLAKPLDKWNSSQGEDAAMRLFGLHNFRTAISDYDCAMVNDSVEDTCVKIEEYLKAGKLLPSYNDFRIQLDTAIMALDQQLQLWDI